MKPKAILLAMMALVMVGCLLGCSIPLANSGEVGFKQCTSWSLYHEAKDTKTTSRASLEAPSFAEWLFGKKPEQPPEPE